MTLLAVSVTVAPVVTDVGPTANEPIAGVGVTTARIAEAVARGAGAVGGESVVGVIAGQEAGVDVDRVHVVPFWTPVPRSVSARRLQAGRAVRLAVELDAGHGRAGTEVVTFDAVSVVVVAEPMKTLDGFAANEPIVTAAAVTVTVVVTAGLVKPALSVATA